MCHMYGIVCDVSCGFDIGYDYWLCIYLRWRDTTEDIFKNKYFNFVSKNIKKIYCTFCMSHTHMFMIPASIYTNQPKIFNLWKELIKLWCHVNIS